MSRVSSLELPPFVELYVGDFLWAMMVYWAMCLVGLRWAFYAPVLAALVFAYGIEFSQLYQADWINDLRHTRLGGLVLGFGFKWTDILAYTLGISLGAFLNRHVLIPALQRKSRS